MNLHAAAGMGNAMGNLINTQSGHVPVIITSGQQARKYTELKAYLTNVDAPKLAEPLVKWSHEPARNSTVQLSSDPRYRGRVMALWSTALVGSTPIGAPIAGAVSQALNPRAAVLLGALACAAAAAISWIGRHKPPGQQAAGNPSGEARPATPQPGAPGPGAPFIACAWRVIAGPPSQSVAAGAAARAAQPRERRPVW